MKITINGESMTDTWKRNMALGRIIREMPLSMPGDEIQFIYNPAEKDIDKQTFTVVWNEIVLAKFNPFIDTQVHSYFGYDFPLGAEHVSALQDCFDSAGRVSEIQQICQKGLATRSKTTTLKCGSRPLRPWYY
jgi:hypothetical protein